MGRGYSTSHWVMVTVHVLTSVCGLLDGIVNEKGSLRLSGGGCCCFKGRQAEGRA